MRWFFILLLFLPFSMKAFDISQLRKSYIAAVKDKEVAEKFYKMLEPQASSSPLMLAYYGSAQAIMAKHAWNPCKKMEYVKSGLKTMETAVAKSPESLEIRFLRFSLEYYLPSFLGLSKHMEEDAAKMLELAQKGQIDIEDPVLVKNVIGFLKKSGRYSAKELTIFDAALNNG